MIEPLSLDEDFLDVTGRSEPGPAIAAEIRAGVTSRTGLTVSAGVSHNKFLAKLASDHDKPDGLTVITAAAAAAFLAPLPARKLWGVGPATAERLAQAGFRTIGDVAASDAAGLQAVVGNSAARLQAFARGIDERPVSRPGRPRSISAETTFDRDVHSWADTADHVRRFARRISEGLDRHDLWARTAVLKVRYGDFVTITRSVTPSGAMRDADAILDAARILAARVSRPPSAGIRLIGLGVQNLVAEPTAERCSRSALSTEQLELF